MSSHSVIQVRFVDASTGKPIGDVQLPIESLPERFDIATTLNIADKAYEVVSATPATAREFQATGTLRIELRELVMMNPRDILFSLPTIQDELPGLIGGSTKVGREVFELQNDDDWRQVELVAESLREAIEMDLHAIEEIYSTHRKGPGFDALHVRKAVPSPLAGGSPTLDELRGALDGRARWFEGLAFKAQAELVTGGFAVELPSRLVLYGRQREGRLLDLCLQPMGADSDLEEEARLLAELAARHHLVLVDWCRAELISPSAERFHSWLVGSH